MAAQPLVMTLSRGSLRLRTIDGALERLRDIAKGKQAGGDASMDGFLAERRAEVAREQTGG